MAVYIASAMANQLIQIDQEQITAKITLMGRLFIADNAEEALEKVTTEFKKQKPTSCGWIAHHIELGEVSKEILKVLLSEARTESEIEVL